jgi:hypothetical protein
MISDDPFRDEAVDRALTSLPRSKRPSPMFVSSVLGELRRRDLVQGPSIRGRRLAAAVAIFAAGSLAGAGASALLVNNATPLVTASEVAATNAVSLLNVPAIGHSEVWF